MGTDYFAILGLTPGRYSAAEVTRRFQERRRRLLAQLDDPRTHTAARQELDALHRAYRVLGDPASQREYLRSRRTEDDVARLRRFIAASLEDGLLRHSRRQEILAAAQRLGFSEFHAHLLIAQVQFGDEQIPMPPGGVPDTLPHRAARVWARFAAAGVLALAMFLGLVRWLGG